MDAQGCRGGAGRRGRRGGVFLLHHTGHAQVKVVQTLGLFPQLDITAPHKIAIFEKEKLISIKRNIVRLVVIVLI